jgi:hypothetical protein
MQNVVPPIGATSLGIVIGWLVRYFIRRFKTFTPSVLSSVLSIVLGGAAIKFLAADKTVWWFYPIGLLIGFIVYQVIVMVLLRPRTVKIGTFDPEEPTTDRVAELLRDNDPRFMRK